MQALSHVSKSYQGHKVLDDVSLSLPVSEVSCLLGPSGCGKSTLLRIVASLVKPESGQVNIDKTECAVVFQEPRLLPWLTVKENLTLALPFWLSKNAKSVEVAGALEQVYLNGTENLMPHELSGGMAQRVGIARALLKKPNVLLMDEPFAALDAITRNELQQMLKRLINDRAITCLFITHDINEALTIGQRLLVMREGKIRFEYNRSELAAYDDLKQTIFDQLQLSNNEVK